MSREKRVFEDIQDVAHLWANAKQDSARNKGGNFYFDGDTIYSYGRHFPAAKRYPMAGPKGGPVFLVTTRTYSRTTSKHMSAVRSAIPRYGPYIIIHCSNVEPVGVLDHKENLEEMILAVKNAYFDFQKARAENTMQAYAWTVVAEMENINRYCRLFRCKTVANKLGYKPKKEWIEIGDELERRLEEVRFRKKKSMEQYVPEANKVLREWLSGERKDLKWEKLTEVLGLPSDYIWIRFNLEMAKFETSKGVKLTLEEGTRLYRVWQRYRKGGEVDSQKAHDQDGAAAIAVGDHKWMPTVINKECVLYGCHRIYFVEMDKAAEQAGIK